MFIRRDFGKTLKKMKMNSNEITHTREVDDIQLTATVPQEMIIAQQSLIEWCNKKLKEKRFNAKELGEATDHAKKNKWRWQVHDRHYKLALKRIVFYEKLKAAVDAGYYIVPNFPVQNFAVRTDRHSPNKMISAYFSNNHEQLTHDQPIGKGDYKSPFPEIYQKTIDEAKNQKQYWAENWEDVEFPVNMAKPIIMEAVSQAMALKIFDRFGVMPSIRKNDDPVIIGQIVRKNGYQEQIVSFMIAWHLNTNIL